jgi:hypothetical protein
MLRSRYEDRYATGLLAGTRSNFVLRRCHGEPACLTLTYSDSRGQVTHTRIHRSPERAGGASLWMTWGEAEEEEDVEAATLDALAIRLSQPPYCLTGLAN